MKGSSEMMVVVMVIITSVWLFAILSSRVPALGDYVGIWGSPLGGLLHYNKYFLCVHIWGWGMEE